MNLFLFCIAIAVVTLAWCAITIYGRSNKGESEWVIPLLVAGFISATSVARWYGFI